MAQESDAERMQNAPTRAFDWVAQELLFPSEQARDILKQAFLKNANQGHDKGARELLSAWTTGLRWTSGEQWLQACANDSLQGLLFARLMHVAHRIYRDPQVVRAIHEFPDVTQVIINRDASYLGTDPCGFGFDVVLDAAGALPLLQRPACEHPACRCTVDPIFKR